MEHTILHIFRTKLHERLQAKTCYGKRELSDIIHDILSNLNIDYMDAKQQATMDIINDFIKTINTKNGWGRNDIKTALDKSHLDVGSRYRSEVEYHKKMKKAVNKIMNLNK